MDPATQDLLERDPVAQYAYNKLRERGLNHTDACDEIGRARAAVMWAVKHELVIPTKANETILYPALRRMARGEAAADVFTDNWSGEAL